MWLLTYSGKGRRCVGFWLMLNLLRISCGWPSSTRMPNRGNKPLVKESSLTTSEITSQLTSTKPLSPWRLEARNSTGTSSIRLGVTSDLSFMTGGRFQAHDYRLKSPRNLRRISDGTKQLDLDIHVHPILCRVLLSLARVDHAIPFPSTPQIRCKKAYEGRQLNTHTDIKISCK